MWTTDKGWVENNEKQAYFKKGRKGKKKKMQT